MNENEQEIANFLADLSDERRFALKDYFIDRYFEDARAIALLQQLYGNTYQALASNQKLPDDTAARLFHTLGYTREKLQVALLEMG